MTTAPSAGGGTRRRVLSDLAVGLPITLLLAAGTWSLLALPATYPFVAVVVYVVAAGLIVATVPDRLPMPGFGPANRVTLGRLLLLMPVTALVPWGGAVGDIGRWVVVGLGTAIMLLDGVDGWVARRTRTETVYGARFDMETDAFLMLVLSLLVWTGGRAGPWVVLIGAMRYLFVAAGFVLPALRGDLFPSWRRKAVCVVQGVALLVCLGPIVPARAAPVVAAVALASLAWSFAVDAVWLLRRGRANDPIAARRV